MPPSVQGLMAFVSVFIFSGLLFDFFWGFFAGLAAFFVVWYTAIPKENRGQFLDNWRNNIEVKLIRCPECRKKASISSTKCQNCGVTFTPDLVQKTILSEKNAIMAKTFFFLASICFFVFFSVFYDQDRPAVYNSPADASVRQVRDYLRQNLKDPSSIEYIEWSRVMPTDNGYLVSVKYRAKNSFGGYVVEQNTFILDKSGGVIRMSGQ